MIGSIRKHSAWLWWLIASLTIVSFIWWGAAPGTRYGSGRNAGLGVLYGKPITPEAFEAAQREFDIFYWSRTHEFPGANASFSPADLKRETYLRLLLVQKAATLGIHVSDEAVATAANGFLSSLTGNKQAVPLPQFVEKVLQPAGLTANDFQRFIRDDLIIQQLVKTMGLSGALVTPQEAGQIYDRENQEVSAQVVFFAASNYLSQVAVTPAGVGQFYTNFMAHYRLPDRVQINYIEYPLSNYLAAAEEKLGKTNLAKQVESAYLERGKELAPDAKTAEEARAKIRELILHQEALTEAVAQARAFASDLFAIEPATPENLVTVANRKGLTVHTTAPFSEAEGPQDFPATADFVSTAFKLNADSPFGSKPYVSTDAVYVFGLARQLPSVVPPLDQIHEQVIHDFRQYEATLKARDVGTNFYFKAAVQMATGKSFTQAAIAAGQAPLALQPFSLSSAEVPEAEGHAEVNEIKKAAFTTEAGHISPFLPTAEGGFVMYVQSLLPVNETEKSAQMPKFLSQLRRGRENDAFNLWLQMEASREIGSILKQLAEQGRPAR
ncbi:MAG TPA: SurA N-terminal domain-containing protein [Verrucomicrobiae bacterium]